MTVPGPVPAVPSAPDREAGDMEAKVGGLIATYRHHLNQGLAAPPPIRQIVAAVCEQVARDIEREHEPGAGFADTWNRAVKRCAAIARGASS